MLFVGTSIIHPSTEGVFLLCNILDLLIYSSKEEQALYDKAYISRDIRNQCFIWAVIMLAGALLSCFLTPYMAIPIYIIWLVLFFREVHFDNHKAFEKYLLK